MVKRYGEAGWRVLLGRKAPVFSGRTRQVNIEKTELPVFWVDLEANILFYLEKGIELP